MPNSKSAEKRVRQNEKARVLNKARKTELRTLRRRFDRAIHDGKSDEADSLYRRYSKRVDQAACRGVLHRNTASRRKARLGHALAKIDELSAEGGKASPAKAPSRNATAKKSKAKKSKAKSAKSKK